MSRVGGCCTIWVSTERSAGWRQVEPHSSVATATPRLVGRSVPRARTAVATMRAIWRRWRAALRIAGRQHSHRRQYRSPQIARRWQPVKERVQTVQRVWKLARLRHRKQLQPEFLNRPRQARSTASVSPDLRSNGVSRGGSRGSPQVRWARPFPAKPKRMRKSGAGPDIDLAAAAALRAYERRAMVTLLVLIIPTLIILNRLENSRSRKKVSVDGFKMINGHIVRRKS
jgi:hypothetical protein